jgi:hypothetical protein
MDGPFAGLMEKDVASTTTLARLRSHRTGGAVPEHRHGSARNWHSMIGEVETIMNAMHNSEASTEVREFRDELSEEQLTKASGGYIGETEKNVSSGPARFAS